MRFSWTDFASQVKAIMALLAALLLLMSGHYWEAAACAVLGGILLVWTAFDRSKRIADQQHLEEVQARRRARAKALDEQDPSSR